MRGNLLWTYSILVMAAILCLAGCESPLSKALFQEQEWSENYALADGVKCSAPEIIDGDLNTVGKILFPDKVYRSSVLTSVPTAEADIILPERKSIRKIVVYSDDLPSFSILASTGEGQWQLIKEFDNNEQKEIIIRTSVVTDTIKVRARAKATFDGLSNRRVGIGQSAKISEPEIKEIELYGFK